MPACGEPWHLHKHLRVCVGESDSAKIIDIVHKLEGIEGAEAQKVELGGKVIGLKCDRFGETTEPGMNPCGCIRIGRGPVRSSLEWG